jgi:hypothetical protein
MAVILILSAMLLPALNLARERSRTAKCLGNQKQCGLALTMYAGDYDGYYPKAYDSAAAGVGIYWGGMMAENRLIEPRILYCPSYEPYYSNFTRYTSTTWACSFQSTYGLRGIDNKTIDGTLIHGYKLPAGNLKTIKSPGSFLLLADSRNLASAKLQFYYLGTSSTPPAYQIHARHQYTANIFCADGSARSASPGLLTDEYGWASNWISQLP